jgi:hypothetical protein
MKRIGPTFVFASLTVIVLSLLAATVCGQVQLPKESSPDPPLELRADVPNRPFLIHADQQGNPCVHTEVEILKVFERAWQHNCPQAGIVAGDKGLGVVLKMPKRLVEEHHLAAKPPALTIYLADKYLRNWAVIGAHSWQDYCVLVGGQTQVDESEWIPVTPVITRSFPRVVTVMWSRVPHPTDPPDEMFYVVVLLHWDSYGDTDPSKLSKVIFFGKAMRSWFTMATRAIESSETPTLAPRQMPSLILPGPGLSEANE